MKVFRTIVAAAGILLASSCQQGQKAYPVFFLVQDSNTVSDAMDSTSARMVVRHDGVTYTRMPVLSLDHFERYESHLNPDDGSYGVTLYGKKSSHNRIYSSTVSKSGMLMLPVVNGLAMTPMVIDPVHDGKLVIWGGLNGYDLKMIAKSVQPINKELEEKRFLDKNPRPLPKDMRREDAVRDFTGRTVREIAN